MSDHFQALLARAAMASPPIPTQAGESPAPASKQLSAMPLKYVQLSLASRTTGMSREDSDTIPDIIEGAIAPHSLISFPGKLVKVHLENADIRYISEMYSRAESLRYMELFHRHKISGSGWDRFGKGRFVAQWSNPAGMKYVFSDCEYTAGGFPDFVEQIRIKVMALLQPIFGADKTNFNYCVCNCYMNGFAGVNWHTDAEPHLVPDCPIACVSFGSERVFSLAKIPSSVTAEIDTKNSLNVRLESGSMIVMAGDTQRNYLHAIAKETRVREPRFSLTFRVNYPQKRGI
jgi:hypothetical protein